MAWYDGAIFYHILPGAVSPDGEKKSAFLCMEEQLPYLKVLGIDAVILGPLFSEDPLCYGARDFTEINPRLGTEEAFCHYVERAHSMGVKVMLDVAVLFSSRSFFAVGTRMYNLLSRERGKTGSLMPHGKTWRTIRSLILMMKTFGCTSWSESKTGSVALI